MQKITVCAYFYDPLERDLILSFMDPVAQTDTFFYGTLKPLEIRKLKDQGILIDLQLAQKSDSIPAQHIPGPNAKSLQLGNIPVDLSPQPSQDHLIALAGPLLEIWHKELKSHGIKLLEALSQQIYKVTNPQEVDLSLFSFIASTRQLRLQDKKLSGQEKASKSLDPFALPKPQIGVYTIRINDQAASETFLNFLKEKDVEILASSSKKFKVLFSQEDQFLIMSSHPAVYGVEEYIPPRLHTDIARKLIKADLVHNREGEDFSLTGKHEIVGIADTGIDQGHPDFKDRLHTVVDLGRKDDPSDPNGHGTHVAGTVAGSGAASQGTLKGIAPEATLYFQSILDSQGGLNGLPYYLVDLFEPAYQAGVRIHNNSWGSSTASEYRFNSLEVDEFVYDHKDMLVVISSGNEGTAAAPRNASSGFVDWLSVGSPATAKNGLTVGASRSSRTKGGFSRLTYNDIWPQDFPDDPSRSTLISGDPEGLAAFSSRGPCGNESRIKPDLVAPGTDIAAAKSSLAPSANFWGPYPKNRQYAFMGGTSMSTPIVSGTAALVREYLRTYKNMDTPSAALIKAILINGTRKLSGVDAIADHDVIPNFHQGFGCLDLGRSIENNANSHLKVHLIDTWQQTDKQFTATGQRFVYRFEIEEGLPLRLCLCWTDYPGNSLQNNLNVLLMQEESKQKWVGNEHLPRNITAFDRDNNVEIIRIPEPKMGSYRLIIQANNILFSAQDFAVSLSGNIPKPLQYIQ